MSARPAALRSALFVLLASLAALAVIAAVDLGSAAAQGDPRVEARAHYMSGKQKFDAGDYRGAIAEFSAADHLAPSAVNDFNMALCYERLDDGAQAIRYYRSYLDRMPNASNRSEVEASIKRLDASRAAAEAARAEAARAEAERAAEAARSEAARAEALRAAEAARAEAERAKVAAGVATAPQPGTQPPVPDTEPPAPATPPRYAPTGDPQLDRAAGLDLSAMQGGAALPPPTTAAPATPAAAGSGNNAATTSSAPAPTSEPTTKKGKPFYKSPVFWVVAAVGVYVVIVLAQDNSTDNQARFTPLPDGVSPAAGGGGATLFRF